MNKQQIIFALDCSHPREVSLAANIGMVVPYHTTTARMSALICKKFVDTYHVLEQARNSAGMNFLDERTIMVW